MAASLITMIKPLEGLVNPYPAEIDEGMEELIK